MGAYHCNKCDRTRHDDDHGFNTVEVAEEQEARCYCDHCFDDALAALLHEQTPILKIRNEEALAWLKANWDFDETPQTAPRQPQEAPGACEDDGPHWSHMDELWESEKLSRPSEEDNVFPEEE